MKQSRKASLMEAVTKVIVGYIVGCVANLLIFPLFNVHVSYTDNLLMGLIYSAISIVLSYTIRRWFTAR